VAALALRNQRWREQHDKENLRYMFFWCRMPRPGGERSGSLAKLMRDELPDFDGPVAPARDSIVSDDQVICWPAEALIVRPPSHQTSFTAGAAPR
jgi:hypothetical protein